jgi:hypothetical protein
VVLLVNHAEHMVKLGQGWRAAGKGTRPSKFATNERHLFNSHIVDESSEAAHHWPIEVGIILVFVLVDHVEISHH